MGFYDKYDFSKENLPDITVLKSEGGHGSSGGALYALGYSVESDSEESIAADVQNSYDIYQDTFGKIGLKELKIIDVPYSHGTSYPGFILLAWSTFHLKQNNWGNQLFRAHEVAHQWWGNRMKNDTYHEKWLTEGLADFCGLWYVQTALNDNDTYFDILDDWQERIEMHHFYPPREEEGNGPISMGYRSQSSHGESGAYSAIVYEKGGWVFHMIRMMLIDQKKMTEDLFTGFLKDLFLKFDDKDISNKQFEELLSYHFSENMSWFMNQWVHGTGIPTYEFAYIVDKTPAGKYKVICQVKQENVPEGFKMYVPIRINFSNNRKVRLRVMIDKEFSQFNLPLLPIEPEEIIFNDLNSVLCNIDNVEFDISLYNESQVSR